MNKVCDLRTKFFNPTSDDYEIKIFGGLTLFI